MRRILTVLAVALVMAAMMLAMAMPAFAYHFSDHPLVTGECGNKGKCTGFGVDDNPGEDQSEDPGKGRSEETGDTRNDVCFDNGVCIGTRNN